jgi:hypothetical protein
MLGSLCSKPGKESLLCIRHWENTGQLQGPGCWNKLADRKILVSTNLENIDILTDLICQQIWKTNNIFD